jgi:cytochrome c
LPVGSLSGIFAGVCHEIALIFLAFWGVLLMLITRWCLLVLICILPVFSAPLMAAVDEDLAEETLEANKCLKCHSITKKKEGPAYKEVAKKYKTKADAEKTLYKHLTTAPMVEIDGVEEEHKIIKTKVPKGEKREQEIYNIIRWILSR